MKKVYYPLLSIIRDWRRNTSIVILLVVAGLLFAFTSSTFIGFQGWQARNIKNLDAPIWLIPKTNRARAIQSVNMGESLVWMHNNVVSVRPIAEPTQMMIKPDAEISNRDRFIEVIAVELDASDVTFPKSLPPEFVKILEVPGNAIMRTADAKNLGLVVGNPIKVSSNRNQDEKMLVLGAIWNHTQQTFFAQIYVSPDTMRIITGANEQSSQTISSYAIKLRDDSTPVKTAQELNWLLDSRGKQLKAITASQLIEDTNNLELGTDVGGDSLQSLVSIVSGFVLIMTTLIMRTNFLSQLKEFGTLNALGLSKLKLAFLVMQQGFWMGLIAGLSSIIIFVILKICLQPFNVFLHTNISILSQIFILLVVISMVSSFASVSVLRKIELTSLLR